MWLLTAYIIINNNKPNRVRLLQLETAKSPASPWKRTATVYAVTPAAKQEITQFPQDGSKKDFPPFSKKDKNMAENRKITSLGDDWQRSTGMHQSISKGMCSEDVSFGGSRHER